MPADCADHSLTDKKLTFWVQHLPWAQLLVAHSALLRLGKTVKNNPEILLVEPDLLKARAIIDALKAGGWAKTTSIPTPAELPLALKQRAPDVILIDLAQPDLETLKHLSIATNANARPVALFVAHTDEAMTQAAISAGFSAYVVDGLHKDRIKAVLETAIVRFQMIDKMHSELASARRALSDRKTIDRAKGVLMKARQMSEEDAYALLRKTAMNQGRKVIDVASALVTTADLLQ